MGDLEDAIVKKIAYAAIGVFGCVLTAGFTFYVDTTKRMAVIEDDLTEAIELMGKLHPPEPSRFTREIAEFSYDKKRKKKKGDRRQRMLEALQEETEIKPEVCDNLVDDDKDGEIDCADTDCIQRKWPGCFASPQ